MESSTIPVPAYSFVSLHRHALLGAFLLLSLLLFACIVHAQEIPTSPTSLDLTASPADPAPGQQVTITAASYTIDINGAIVAWSINGTQVQKGLGQTTLTIPAPAIGKTASVSAVAVSAGGQAVTGTISITSGSVDMILEPSGYVPPFFIGKDPVTYQNSVKIIAVPHIADPSGVEYSPSSLVYTWKQDDGTVLQDQSGYGKQSVVMPGAAVPRPYTLTVDVSTKDGSVSTEGTVFVTPQAPSLVFYVDDPLYGPLYNTAVGNTVYIGSQKEVSVLAVPYGFDGMQNGAGSLPFSWLINGNSDTALDSSDSIILRAPANSSGSSNIELDLSNPSDILQQISGAFSAVFNSNAQPASSTATAF